MTTLHSLVALTCLLAGATEAADQSERRPNILWLTSEDHGPEMGCYGDKLARTPNIDALAAKGMLFKHAWSTAPVCARRTRPLSPACIPPAAAVCTCGPWSPCPLA